MDYYQQKPFKAAQWFPGVVIEGVREVNYSEYPTRGKFVGEGDDVWLDAGDWLCFGPVGEFCLPDEAFRANYSPMPPTPTSLFADMLGLLKELEWAYSTSEVWPGDFCPVCDAPKFLGHAPTCHLHATIALAEEHLRIVGTDPTPT